MIGWPSATIAEPREIIGSIQVMMTVMRHVG
jgi:hypothetical protein